MMTNDRTSRIPANLERGFRADYARLDETGRNLAAELEHARHFGGNTSWREHWDCVEEILLRKITLVKEMHGFTEQTDGDRIQEALAAWETFVAEDARLVEVLRPIREQVGQLSPTAREDWNILACSLDAHLEIIHACAQAQRIKVELLSQNPREDVERLVQDIIAKFPSHTLAGGVDAAIYEQEWNKAEIELGREHHEYLGFMDVVKAMFMWVETPEERMHKNRSLIVREE